MKILNELAHAEKLLKNGFSKFMSLVDLMVLAKYFRYLNKSNAEIEQELFKFCRTFAGEFSEIIFSDQIEKAIRYSKRYDLRIPVDVPITSKEVEAIKRLHNYRYEKIIFTMLVLGRNIIFLKVLVQFIDWHTLLKRKMKIFSTFFISLDLLIIF